MRTNQQSMPFSAIVGQEKLKSAYLANVILPRIGGLLISGPKGTGKSTMVHAIAGILPTIEVVAECVFNCDPSGTDLCTLCRARDERHTRMRPMRIVNLPLSCTEDRLVGSIDVEKLLSAGRREVQPGILGEAHRNILYVDEVNLLPDHLVDDILDAAARHWNTIEREGVSVAHPADFVLVGSMNPEEGELRPQILDRFPLCCRIDSVRDPDLRVEIVQRNLLHEQNSEALHELFTEEEAVLRATIHEARERLPHISVPEAYLYAIALGCVDLKVDGQRPDIVIAKTARALAALAGRDAIAQEQVLLAAELTLNHRTRDGGLLDPPTSEEILQLFRIRLDAIRAASLEDGHPRVRKDRTPFVRPGTCACGASDQERIADPQPATHGRTNQAEAAGDVPHGGGPVPKKA